uniref:Uncharacterized protein n=1 Tax=Rhizophora mucronata TaxID=61149 RepID=A0A2P2PN84_RHIMU
MFGKKLSKYLLHFSSMYLSKGCSVETVCFALCETIYCAFLLWWQLTYLLLLTAVFPSPILAGASQILAQYYQFIRLGFEASQIS